MYSVDEIIEQIDQESDIEDNLGTLEETTETQENDAEAEDATKVKPKAKRKLGSRPKLDAERLKGPRGLICMERMFSDLKFKGHGHEKQDLNQIMNTLQYWCHRLFPKFTFDDCLAQLERLGTKKPVITLKKKILFDMIDDLLPHDPDVIDDAPESQQETLDEFDMLLNQEPSTSFTAQPAVTAEVVELTEEQKEIIARNRQLAAERRKARLEAMKEKQETSIIQSSQTSTNSQSLILTEEQKLIIEKNRLLAIERRKQNKSNVQVENNVSQNLSQSFTTNQQNETETNLNLSQETNSRAEVLSQNLDKTSEINSEENNLDMSQNSEKALEQSNLMNQKCSESEINVDPSQENNMEAEVMSQNLDKDSERSHQLSQKHNEPEMDVDPSQENNLESEITSQNSDKAAEQLNQLSQNESKMDVDPSEESNLELVMSQDLSKSE